MKGRLIYSNDSGPQKFLPVHSAGSVIKPCQSPISVYLSTSHHWLLLLARFCSSADWRVVCSTAASSTPQALSVLSCDRVGLTESMCTFARCLSLRLSAKATPGSVHVTAQQSGEERRFTSYKSEKTAVIWVVQVGPSESCCACREKWLRLLKGKAKRRPLWRRFNTLIRNKSKSNFHTGMRV